MKDRLVVQVPAGDGDYDTNDKAAIDSIVLNAFSPFGEPISSAAYYDPDADLDRNGIINGTDSTLGGTGWAAALARGVLSSGAVDNATGFDGYRYNAETYPSGGQYTVRHRWYDPVLGRWLQRDPAGYVDSMSLYLFNRSTPLTHNDSTGLKSWEIDKNRCTITMEFVIQIVKWTGNWTRDRQRNFMWAFKWEIEHIWNNNPHRIVPQNAKYTRVAQGGPGTGGGGGAVWTCDCPCPTGFRPRVDIRWSESYINWFDDNEMTVAANPQTSYRFIRSGVRYSAGTSEMDEADPWGEYGRTTQSVPAHEFGHMIGLHHPGHKVPGIGGNAGPEYTYQGNDYKGNPVDGTVDLMGIGNGFRPFYFDRWQRELNNNRYNGCNYVVQ